MDSKQGIGDTARNLENNVEDEMNRLELTQIDGKVMQKIEGFVCGYT